MSKNYRYYWFIFKWFLIGKYHCDTPPCTKKAFYIVHKVLWLVICLCVVYGSASFVKSLLPYLE